MQEMLKGNFALTSWLYLICRGDPLGWQTASDVRPQPSQCVVHPLPRRDTLHRDERIDSAMRLGEDSSFSAGYTHPYGWVGLSCLRSRDQRILRGYIQVAITPNTMTIGI